jgi:hypothetical protein
MYAEITSYQEVSEFVSFILSIDTQSKEIEMTLFDNNGNILHTETKRYQLTADGKARYYIMFIEEKQLTAIIKHENESILYLYDHSDETYIELSKMGE